MTDEQAKTCKKCGETKPLSEFYKHKGYTLGVDSKCKVCAIADQQRRDALRTDERRVYGQAYHASHRHSQNARSRAYYAEHKEEMNAQSRDYHATHGPQVRAANKRWREENRDYIAAKAREVYAGRPDLRIRQSISTSMRRSIAAGTKGRRSTFDILGYTLEELMSHLERQFTEGMTWDNYEYRGWHIDHIRPQSSFTFKTTDDPEFKECWALSNLQPMWGVENISKGPRWSLPAPANDNNLSEAA